MQAAREYDIRLDAGARRDLKKLARREFQRIDERIVALGTEPRPAGATKLWNDSYRIRIGPWRVIYLVDDDERVVVITAVRRRGESTYRGL